VGQGDDDFEVVLPHGATAAYPNIRHSGAASVLRLRARVELPEGGGATGTLQVEVREQQHPATAATGTLNGNEGERSGRDGRLLSVCTLRATHTATTSEFVEHDCELAGGLADGRGVTLWVESTAGGRMRLDALRVL
jgi:hypothetical protein